MLQYTVYSMLRNIFNPITNIFYLHGNNSLGEYEAGRNGGSIQGDTDFGNGLYKGLVNVLEKADTISRGFRQFEAHSSEIEVTDPFLAIENKNSFFILGSGGLGQWPHAKPSCLPRRL